MAILSVTFFPFMLSFVSFYMTLGVQLFFPIPAFFFRQVGFILVLIRRVGVQPLLPYMSCVF
jgi:hypothetical protein